MAIKHIDILKTEKSRLLDIPEHSYCYRCDEPIHIERDQHIVAHREGKVFCSLTCFMRHCQAEIVNEVEVPY